MNYYLAEWPLNLTSTLSSYLLVAKNACNTLATSGRENSGGRSSPSDNILRTFVP